MPSSTWKGNISFGLVSVPIRLFSAARYSHVAFHEIHKTCGTRVHQQLYCPHDERVVSRDEIAMGYEVEKEKDKYVLASVLDALAKVDKPNAVPLSTVFALLSDARWLVRHSAIRALRRASAPAVEQKLIEHLAATTEPYDMAYCHSVLGDVGSPRALPALEVGLSSRKRDVKNSAEEAIRAIKLRFAPSGMQ